MAKNCGGKKCQSVSGYFKTKKKAPLSLGGPKGLSGLSTKKSNKREK